MEITTQEAVDILRRWMEEKQDLTVQFFSSVPKILQVDSAICSVGAVEEDLVICSDGDTPLFKARISIASASWILGDVRMVKQLKATDTDLEDDRIFLGAAWPDKDLYVYFLPLSQMKEGI